jgi:hypothetical protein
MTVRRYIEMFRIGSVYHGYVYRASVVEPGKYMCERGWRSDHNEILWLFHVEDLGWIAVEAPKIRMDGSEPDKEWLWAYGKKVFWCKHTAIRDGWHRWAPWGEDDWDVENRFWCKTEVALHLPCLHLADHDGVVDLEEDPSDTDVEGMPTY